MSTPLAHSIAEACALTSAGKTALYQAIKCGALRAVKRGRRTVILGQDLRRWVETLPSVAVKTPLQNEPATNADGMESATLRSPSRESARSVIRAGGPK